MLVSFELIRLEAAEDSRICRENDPVSANAAVLGAYKADSFKSHTHPYNFGLAAGFASGALSGSTNTSTTGATGGSETRPVNTALFPRLRN